MERLLFHLRIQRGAMITERNRIARQYLSGEGIEIGALHNPMKLTRAACVRYVDYIDQAQARSNYPELKHHKLTPVDIVDDGETLTSIARDSVDFIVANHMIEHCVNPLKTIENWLSKLRSGGRIFMAVPDMAHTFDRHRQPTETEHLLRDWREGGEISLREHYLDWGHHITQLEGEALTTEADRMLSEKTNIHFHAWRLPDFAEAVRVLSVELGGAFEIELGQNNGDEFLVILRKNEEN